MSDFENCLAEESKRRVENWTVVETGASEEAAD